MITRPTALMVDAIAREFRALTWPQRSNGFAFLWHDLQSSPAAWRMVVTVTLEHLGAGQPDCADIAAWQTVSFHDAWITAGDRWWREHPHAVAAFQTRLPIYVDIMPAVLDDLATRRAVALAQEAPPDLLGDFIAERRRFETPHKGR